MCSHENTHTSTDFIEEGKGFFSMIFLGRSFRVRIRLLCCRIQSLRQRCGHSTLDLQKFTLRNRRRSFVYGEVVLTGLLNFYLIYRSEQVVFNLFKVSTCKKETITSIRHRIEHKKIDYFKYDCSMLASE